MRNSTLIVLLVFLFATVVAVTARGETSVGSLNFSNTPLLRSDGNSEPAIAIAPNGATAVSGLQWLFDPASFGTNLWTGPFGSTPLFQGLIDAGLRKPGSQVFGSFDADIDLGSTGTLNATTLAVLVNPPFSSAQQGVSAIRCPNATSPGFGISGCTEQLIDTTTSDRPWITSDGARVYIAYHNVNASFSLRVQRSDDDGVSWQPVRDPIVGQGGATANAIGSALGGPIVADPSTHNVYEIYTASDAGGNPHDLSLFRPNQVYVSRSTNGGKSWIANLVFNGPSGLTLANIVPSLAVDPTNGDLHAAWSDGSSVFFSTSSDQGTHWTSTVTVNTAPATTAIMPSVAAYNGTVDVVYYGTNASSKDDPSAVWNVYLAQTTNDGASFTQSRVSSAPNHVGVVCTTGGSCAQGTRNLLDLFEVAIDPQNGRAGVVYTADTLTTTGSGTALPQVVLAQQN